MCLYDFVCMHILYADMKESLQDLTNRVDKSSRRMELKIHAEKTKTMAIGKQHDGTASAIGNRGAGTGHEICLSERTDNKELTV